MTTKETRRAKFILIAVAIAGILVAAVLVTLSRIHQRVFWTAPPGESVRYVRTGTRLGHVLVLSESSSHWFLRDVSETGRARLMATGEGAVQPAVPMSPLNWQRDRLLLGMGRSSKRQPFTIVECELKTGKITPLSPTRPHKLRMFTFPLLQAYSPDSNKILLVGPCVDWGPKGLRGDGIWLMDRKTKRVSLIRRVRGIHYVAWGRQGTVYAFQCSTGMLFTGSMQGFESSLRLIRASLAAPSPKGGTIIVVRDTPSLTVYSASLPKGKLRKLYDLNSWAAAVDVEWSPDGRYAIVSAAGPRVVPVLIDPEGRAEAVVSVPNTWVGQAGAAFLTSHYIAVVDQPRVGGPYRLVRVRVR